MSKLQILRFPHPFLRNKAHRAEALTPELVELSRNMLQLMYESHGVGLAAVQVGKPVALLTADTRLNFQSSYYQPEPLSSLDSKAKREKKSPNPSEPPSSLDSKETGADRYDRDNLSCSLESKIKQPLILFNPKVVEKKGEVLFQEGCLSFPSYYAEVKRAEIVTVEALNPKNEKVTITTDGLLSICLQHEIDHLQGKLFIDHLSIIKANRLKEEIKKYGYPDSLSSIKSADEQSV